MFLIAEEYELFTFHSKEWWRKLWEKTGLCCITACYDFEDTRAAWEAWAKWEKENMNDGFDERFLAADTDNDVAFILLAARKNA